MPPTESAARVPGPPGLLPGRPDAVIDLQTDEGVALVGGEWRYSDTRVEEIDFVEVGPDLGPTGAPNRTYDVTPHAQDLGFDDSAWQVLAPRDTERRLSTGRVCFNWYRIAVTIPQRVGDFDPAGSTAVFEIVIDDYAEVWVNGQLPLSLGRTGGQVAAGFNAPNRVVLGTDVQPSQRFEIAVFGVNGPISTSPRNYIWVRSATLDLYRAERARSCETGALDVIRIDPALDGIVPEGAAWERIAGGFDFTDGPLWAWDGTLLFSSPDMNTIFRWSPLGLVDVVRVKSGYTGTDIGRYQQPGSNGLTLDAQGRLTICQHGNRRVIRVEPHGDITVVADRHDGKRLNSPNDLVYRSDGALFFTDPPFGLPQGADDPKRELPFSGVFAVVDGEVRLVTDELPGPKGLAFSPDERLLYVGNWDRERRVVMRYAVDAAGRAGDGAVFVDMTQAAGDDVIGGIKVDRAGNVYVCGPGGLWILSPDGRHLGTLRLPEVSHNLAWGDDDARSLYVTAMTSVYRILLSMPGIRPDQKG